MMKGLSGRRARARFPASSSYATVGVGARARARLRRAIRTWGVGRFAATALAGTLVLALAWSFVLHGSLERVADPSGGGPNDGEADGDSSPAIADDGAGDAVAAAPWLPPPWRAGASPYHPSRAFCAWGGESAAADPPVAYNGPMVCAHGGNSGDSGLFPNTQASYASAIAAWAQSIPAYTPAPPPLCVEVDVSLTSDGVLASLHSRDLAHLLGLDANAALRRALLAPASDGRGGGANATGQRAPLASVRDVQVGMLTWEEVASLSLPDGIGAVSTARDVLGGILGELEARHAPAPTVLLDVKTPPRPARRIPAGGNDRGAGYEDDDALWRASLDRTAAAVASLVYGSPEGEGTSSLSGARGETTRGAGEAWAGCWKACVVWCKEDAVLDSIARIAPTSPGDEEGGSAFPEAVEGGRTGVRTGFTVLPPDAEGVAWRGDEDRAGAVVRDVVRRGTSEALSGATELNFHYEAATAAAVGAVRRWQGGGDEGGPSAGRSGGRRWRVYGWTANTDEIARHLLDAGVDAVVTSFPARLRALVEGGIALCNAGAAARGPEL